MSPVAGCMTPPNARAASEPKGGGLRPGRPVLPQHERVCAMSDHDDFAFDVAPGIPAPLPKGETILWQGRPAVLPLAREAWKMNWVIGYMAAILLWKTDKGAVEEGA